MRCPKLSLSFSSGSVLATQKATHGRHCDILAVADSRLIDGMVPKHARFRLDFLTNEIVLGGTQMSKYINEINKENWPEILLREDVRFGRADASLDPCGYWTLLSWKLADKHYLAAKGAGRISDRLWAKQPEGGSYVREDSHKILSLVEATGGIDYAFVYRSQAADHGLRIVDLPPEINLGDPAQEDLYKSVNVEVKRDGKAEIINGKVILYAMTILNDCKDVGAATEFVLFLLGERGQALLRDAGFPPIHPARLHRHNSAEVPELGSLVTEVKTHQVELE
jgi:molybdate/tungstate transport system substrate-binding protein